MIDKLKEIIIRYDDLNKKLSNPDIINNIPEYTKLTKEHNDLQGKAQLATLYLNKNSELEDLQYIIKEESDKDIKDLANQEYEVLLEEINSLTDKIKIILINADPDDSKNIIFEIRAGTGGDEAALFASNLFRMYNRYSEIQGWVIEIMTLNQNEGGGIKEAIFLIRGDNAYGHLKYESGVHRVQRVPETESSGRLHTSAATVAVLPEAEDIDFAIIDSELKIDTYRASGAGGQHVNKTESAIRITHIPSGLVVTCQDESSQHKNKDKALKVLRARLYDLQREKQMKKRADARKSMVSTGDRSAKIRTYNFPQGRVTDHRINLTLYKLNEIMNGDISELIEKLRIEDQKSQLTA